MIKKNLIQGDEFKLSREVLSAKRKQLVVEGGKGNHQQASREVTAVEDKLFAEGKPQLRGLTIDRRLPTMHLCIRLVR